jgi:hypothetical protein
MSAASGMTLRRGLLVLAACAAVIAPAAHAQYSATRIAKHPDEIVYKGLPGDLPTAVLYGDPNRPGPFVMRMKIPAGVKVFPHWNPDEAHTLTVLAGTLYYGSGEQWDEAKLTPYPPGSFLAEPPKTPHFSWAKDGEVILQITGIGPTGAMPVQQPEVTGLGRR